MEYISGLEILNKCLNCEQYVLLFFTAGWCGPCKRIYPELEKLYEKLNKDLVKIYKLDVDEEDNAEILKIFKIKSMPSFCLMKDKNCINTFNGSDIEGIKKMLNIQ
jgi:thioredoxin 1